MSSPGRTSSILNDLGDLAAIATYFQARTANDRLDTVQRAIDEQRRSLETEGKRKELVFNLHKFLLKELPAINDRVYSWILLSNFSDMLLQYGINSSSFSSFTDKEYFQMTFDMLQDQMTKLAPQRDEGNRIQEAFRQLNSMQESFWHLAQSSSVKIFNWREKNSSERTKLAELTNSLEEQKSKVEKIIMDHPRLFSLSGITLSRQAIFKIIGSQNGINRPEAISLQPLSRAMIDNRQVKVGDILVANEDLVATLPFEKKKFKYFTADQGYAVVGYTAPGQWAVPGLAVKTDYRRQAMVVTFDPVPKVMTPREMQWAERFSIITTNEKDKE